MTTSLRTALDFDRLKRSSSHPRYDTSKVRGGGFLKPSSPELWADSDSTCWLVFGFSPRRVSSSSLVSALVTQLL